MTQNLEYYFEKLFYNPEVIWVTQRRTVAAYFI